MKKRSKLFLVLAMMSAMSLSACSLNLDGPSKTTPTSNPTPTQTGGEIVDDTKIRAIYTLYADSVENPLSYEEWLESIRGHNGATILIGQGEPASAEGALGDVYIDTSSYDIYLKLADGWAKQGSIMGPQGPQGLPGQNGQDGQPGKDGTSLLTGNGEPVNSQGNDGDSYIDLISWNYYVKENGQWALKGNIKGEQGLPGQNGENGQDGVTPHIGENGNWYIGEVDTGIPATGPQGQPGQNGTNGENGQNGVTPHIGDNGNWYIGETDTGIPATGPAGTNGTNGENGQNGQDGISIVSSSVDESGDLIITFSNGEIVNAGHIKDVNEHTVKFYCDDLLVDTQVVKHGNKVDNPKLEDFVVKHWYLDKNFEYEWYWYGCVVTEDMSLYGDYQAIPKTLSFDKTANVSIDSYGFGTARQLGKEICVSKGLKSSNYLTVLEDRGILFNKSEIGLITELTIDVESEGFSSAKLYYGNTPFSFDYSVDLVSGNNVIELSKAEYFTIQNTSSSSININSLDLKYEKKATMLDNSLPTVIINTQNSQSVTSRTEYVTCDVSTVGSEKDVTQLKAQIKLRGNSTANCPKKPYRIKLDKKNSLFGYTKAKNWALLAEYMDGSNMHNYTALKFSKMIRGEDTFGTDPLHVNVTLNGENVGIYTFCEHIDAKEGRLDIEQDNIWEKSFNDINFYIERDLSTAEDSAEIEGVTYFKVPLENYPLSKYYFALKYPEKEDFEEELKDGTIIPHEEEFQSFFNSLKDYMTDICNKFVDYYNDTSKFENVSKMVDMESLAMYAVTDQAFGEADHDQKSFKMYRKGQGLLEFGPNWDYDSCAYSLPYKGTYVLNPFTVGGSYSRTTFGEKWGSALYNDTVNGRPFFKAIWDKISMEQLNSFIEAQLLEINAISHSSIYDCERWMHNQYYSMFDNIKYYWRYVTNQLPYLKGLFS